MATGEKSWTVDIEHRVKAVKSCSGEGELWKNASIYKVPAFARELNSKAFTPQLVSFGPYHYNNDQLKLMEVHKERALVHFLARADRPLDDFLSAVGSMVQQLQDSYYRLDDKWRTNRDDFLKLMIIDGCFMLEILQFMNHSERGYASSDPFFSQHGFRRKMPYIRRDMLMIENQLPLLLLKKLVAVEKQQTNVDDDDIHKMVLRFTAGGGAKVERMGLRLHVLDLYRQSLTQNPAYNYLPTATKTKLPRMTHTPIRCAEELREAGVRFKKSSSTSLKDISFSRGILSLPEIVVDDATECTFLNIVAFEHLHVNTGDEVTSYVTFMDEIIDSARDVRLLHRKGIIEYGLGSDKAVAQLFNSLPKDLTLDPDNSLGHVRQQVNNFCQKGWPRWKADLRHTYFRNPWSLFSLAAALLVIVLTISQTVFTVLDYYNSS